MTDQHRHRLRSALCVPPRRGEQAVWRKGSHHSRGEVRDRQAAQERLHTPARQRPVRYEIKVIEVTSYQIKLHMVESEKQSRPTPSKAEQSKVCHTLSNQIKSNGIEFDGKMRSDLIRSDVTWWHQKTDMSQEENRSRRDRVKYHQPYTRIFYHTCILDLRFWNLDLGSESTANRRNTKTKYANNHSSENFPSATFSFLIFPLWEYQCR